MPDQVDFARKAAEEIFKTLPDCGNPCDLTPEASCCARRLARCNERISGITAIIERCYGETTAAKDERIHNLEDENRRIRKLADKAGVPPWRKEGWLTP